MWKSRWLGLLLGAGLIWSQSALALARDTTASSTTADPAEVIRGLASLKTGTTISAELDGTVDAYAVKPGDFVWARVTKNVKQRGQKVIRKGDFLLGRVNSVEVGSRYQAGSQLRVTFIRLIRGNAAYLFNTVVSSVDSTIGDLVTRNKMSLLDESALNGSGIASGRNQAGGTGADDGPGGYWRGGSVTQGTYININGAPPGAEGRGVRTSGLSTQKSVAAVLPASDPDSTKGGSRLGLSTPLDDTRVSSQPDALHGGPPTSILGSRIGVLRLMPGSRMKFKVSNESTVESSKR